MKRKDLLLIVVVIIISTAFALLLSSVLIPAPQKNLQEVEVVDAITDNFPPPDSRYFNDQSINPTQLITIGNNANPTPFNSKKQ